MKNLNSIKEILEALGWTRIPCKNTAMVSFTKENLRLNYYFTTGTTTIQDDQQNIKVYKEVNTDVEMEKTICKYQN